MSVTISEAVKYIGVDDKTIDLFESQYPVPTGVSYNSYVILDEKTAILDTVDKSTIFRTLTLFLSHHLIHSIDDGTGSFKYAVCSDSCSCDVSDLHTHFHCEKCNKTFCFTNIPTPVVKLPQGFTLNSINYVLKGICPDCAAEVNREA